MRWLCAEVSSVCPPSSACSAQLGARFLRRMPAAAPLLWVVGPYVWAQKPRRGDVPCRTFTPSKSWLALGVWVGGLNLTRVGPNYRVHVVGGWAGACMGTLGICGVWCWVVSYRVCSVGCRGARPSGVGIAVMESGCVFSRSEPLQPSRGCEGEGKSASCDTVHLV